MPTLAAFKGACVGAFADGAGLLGNDDNLKSTVGNGGGSGSLAQWGTRTVATPVDSIFAGDAIVVAIVVIVVVVVVVFVVFSRDVAAEGRVGMTVPPLSLSLLTSLSTAAALFPPLNVHHSTLHCPDPTLCSTCPVYHHHCPPVRASPATFCCRLPPLRNWDIPSHKHQYTATMPPPSASQTTPSNGKDRDRWK